jgi:hypothetical protein
MILIVITNLTDAVEFVKEDDGILKRSLLKYFSYILTSFAEFRRDNCTEIDNEEGLLEFASQDVGSQCLTTARGTVENNLIGERNLYGLKQRTLAVLLNEVLQLFSDLRGTNKVVQFERGHDRLENKTIGLIIIWILRRDTIFFAFLSLLPSFFYDRL